MKEKSNKWKTWKYETKYTSVRRKIKRRTNKAERRNAKARIFNELKNLDW